jgi:hypothetical protein
MVHAFFFCWVRVPAKKEFKEETKHSDNRLSKREFRDFFHRVVVLLSDGDGGFDYFIEFLINSVEVIGFVI